MPPKKGKKGKGKDDDWGNDKEVEEKLKKLMVVDDDGGEFKVQSPQFFKRSVFCR